MKPEWLFLVHHLHPWNRLILVVYVIWIYMATWWVAPILPLFYPPHSNQPSRWYLAGFLTHDLGPMLRGTTQWRCGDTTTMICVDTCSGNNPLLQNHGILGISTTNMNQQKIAIKLTILLDNCSISYIFIYFFEMNIYLFQKKTWNSCDTT